MAFTCEVRCGKHSLYPQDSLEAAEGEGEGPDVARLTLMFSLLYFLAATQDIAVDGWALTMLKPVNVGLAATCNQVGQQLGRVVGYTIFTSLEAGGVLDTAQFMLLWGVVFLLTTTTIAIFKKEESLTELQKPSRDEDRETIQELDLGLVKAYKMLWKIIRSPRMYIIIIIYLTFNFGFSAAESIYSLKLVEYGVPREIITQLNLPMIPVQIILTLLISRFTVGSRPLNVFLLSAAFRLIFCAALTLIVSQSEEVPPHLISLVSQVYMATVVGQEEEEEGDSFPGYFYGLLSTVFVLHQISWFSMRLSLVAFHARQTDPARVRDSDVAC